jgi:SAM-dependent methyltransferase
MKCRNCEFDLVHPFIDLGTSPPSNAYLTANDLHGPEKWFPLRVLACTNCWLVQTEDFTDRKELFAADYAYFSSVSSTWVRHCQSYVQRMIERFSLGPATLVVEVATNDGCLLRQFRERGVACLGIEPTKSTATAARSIGIEIVDEFFGVELAKRLALKGRSAALIAANNVLAHVPDIRDFVCGFPILLAPDGVATFEFPHLEKLVAQCQFDTIYHEHFSYLSLSAVMNTFEHCGLTVFDVEELPTHGGSLRVYAQRTDAGSRAVSGSVAELVGRERANGVQSSSYYTGFGERALAIKFALLEFLLNARREGRTVAAYGAAAKGNTLLNYCGVRSDLVSFVVDRNQAKQGKFLPGSRIPIVNEDHLLLARPDYILLLPWNLREELMEQLSYTRKWGAKFAIAVPSMELL